MVENHIVELHYRISDSWRNTQFIATGCMPDQYSTAHLDMIQATPDKRAAILPYIDENLVLDNEDLPAYEGEPKVSEVAADCILLSKETMNHECSRLVRGIANAALTLRNKISSQSAETPGWLMLSLDERSKAQALGISLVEYDAVLAEYLANLPEFVRLANKARERKLQADAKTEKQKQAQRAAFDEEKQAWIAEHGSEHLRRAFLTNGYDCHRRYVVERAAYEAPDYVVDYDKVASWVPVSTPSIEALDIVDEARAKSIGQPIVVWLTYAPQNQGCEEDEDCFCLGSFTPSEAVVIRDYLGQYTLFKIV